MRAKRLWLFGAGAADVGQSRFFKDQTYHFGTLRVLSGEPYGGADTAEVLETIKHIKSGDAQGWYKAWSTTAERTLALAERTQDAQSRGRSFPEGPYLLSRGRIPTPSVRSQTAHRDSEELIGFLQWPCCLGRQMRAHGSSIWQRLPLAHELLSRRGARPQTNLAGISWRL